MGLILKLELPVKHDVYPLLLHCNVSNLYKRGQDRGLDDNDDLIHQLPSKGWGITVTDATVGSKTVAMFEGFGLSAMQRLI